MKPFAAPTDDILFCLHHIADGQSLASWDGDMASGIAEHFARFTESDSW